jgi:hypothetical protein
VNLRRDHYRTGPPGHLRSNPWIPDVLRRLVRRVNASMLRRLIINGILKLSTKDLLALVSMKNAAKREM